jgi:hypothetical protein
VASAFSYGVGDLGGLRWRRGKLGPPPCPRDEPREAPWTGDLQAEFDGEAENGA